MLCVVLAITISFSPPARMAIGALKDLDIASDVKSYYGETLKTSNDLKTNACCTGAEMPEVIKAALRKCHPEVIAKYYGCGLCVPDCLEGLSVLDLGCNQVSDAGLVELANALRDPLLPPHGRKPLGYLTQLSLGGNPFGEAGTRALAAACAEGALAADTLVLTPRARQRLEQAVGEHRASAAPASAAPRSRAASMTLRRRISRLEVSA